MSAIDGFCMFMSPPAQCFKDVDLLFGNSAVGFRADIEQKVAAHTDHVGKDADDQVDGFVVSIVRLITPGIVHRHAKFPVFIFGSADRESLLRGGIIPIARKTGVDDDLRIVFQQHLPDFCRMPLFGALLPVAVEPEKVRIELSGDLIDLVEVEFHKGVPADGIIGISFLRSSEIRIIRVRPIQ